MKKIINLFILTLTLLFTINISYTANTATIKCISNKTPDILDNKVKVILNNNYSKAYNQINKNFITNKLRANQTRNTALFDENYNDKSNNIYINFIEDLTVNDRPFLTPNNNWQPESKQILLFEIYPASTQNVKSVISELKTLPSVFYAEAVQNLIIKQYGNISNDPLSQKQWALHHENGINVAAAWEIADGFRHNKPLVGVFEEYLPFHDDINQVVEFGVGTRPRGVVCPHHGTAVAGIIGGLRGNNLGIAGVSSSPIVLLNHGGITSVNSIEFIRSINWAINHEVLILNASFGFYKTMGSCVVPAPPQISHYTIIRNFNNHNGILIGAAGNSERNADINTSYPAGFANNIKYPNINNVLTVGAININGQRSVNSNFGNNTVRIFAPGENIISTSLQDTFIFTQVKPGFAFFTGTSVAAPHVTGVVALMRQVNPGISPAMIINFLLSAGRNITFLTAYGNIYSRIIDAGLTIHKMLNSQCVMEEILR